MRLPSKIEGWNFLSGCRVVLLHRAVSVMWVADA